MVDEARAVVYADGAIEVCILAQFYDDGLNMPVSIRSASEGVWITRAKMGGEDRLRETYDKVFDALAECHGGIESDTGWRPVALPKRKIATRASRDRVDLPPPERPISPEPGRRSC